MILYLQEYCDEWIIMSNICYAMSIKKFGPIVRELESTEPLNILPGDTVHAIVGHGSPGGIGEYDAAKLAAYLKPLAGRITEVTLFSCSAGVVDKGQPSLVEQLSHVLGGIPVTGKNGLALNSVAIGERVVKISQTDDYGDLEDEVLGEHKLLGVPASARWPEIKDLSFEDKCKYVGQKTCDVYQELIAASDAKKYLERRGDGIVTYP